MREEMLRSILSDLNRSSGGVEGSAVISTDGLIIAAELNQGVDEDRVGAVAAAMLSLGDRASIELRKGGLDQVMIKGDTGYILLVHAGPDAVLTLITKNNAKLGLVLLDATRAADSIDSLL